MKWRYPEDPTGALDEDLTGALNEDPTVLDALRQSPAFRAYLESRSRKLTPYKRATYAVVGFSAEGRAGQAVSIPVMLHADFRAKALCALDVPIERTVLDPGAAAFAFPAFQVVEGSEPPQIPLPKQFEVVAEEAGVLTEAALDTIEARLRAGISCLPDDINLLLTDRRARLRARRHRVQLAPAPGTLTEICATRVGIQLCGVRVPTLTAAFTAWRPMDMVTCRAGLAIHIEIRFLEDAYFRGAFWGTALC